MFRPRRGVVSLGLCPIRYRERPQQAPPRQGPTRIKRSLVHKLRCGIGLHWTTRQRRRPQTPNFNERSYAQIVAQVAGTPQAAIDVSDVLRSLDACARAVHGKNWRALAALCEADVAVSGFEEGSARGSTAIADIYARRLMGLAPTVRISGEVRIGILGDTATAATKMMAAHHVEATNMEPQLLGFSYHDVLARTVAGWRLAHRHLVATWVTSGDILEQASGLTLREAASGRP
jgi:hypothetical protein